MKGGSNSGVGNELLVSASRVIRLTLQPGEFAARVKGDEFAALLTPGDAYAHGELRERVARALNAPGLKLNHLKLALHVGVHRYDPSTPQTAESFMNAGWQRLRSEKKSVETLNQF
ncbi:MAG TPA: diguanylate cyclase [Candidatus Eremiobacteraceae bacterium]|nr:diguanylate cyclase [Candidatus Eremiobacteraceae bacterium]